jgi:hypothetical protein
MAARRRNMTRKNKDRKDRKDRKDKKNKNAMAGGKRRRTMRRSKTVRRNKD